MYGGGAPQQQQPQAQQDMMGMGRQPPMQEAPEMPDMNNLQPMNKRRIAAAAQRNEEEDDGGWGAGELLDWYSN